MLSRQAAKLHDEITELEAIIAKEGHTVRTDRGGASEPCRCDLGEQSELALEADQATRSQCAATIPARSLTVGKDLMLDFPQLPAHRTLTYRRAMLFDEPFDKVLPM